MLRKVVDKPCVREGRREFEEEAMVKDDQEDAYAPPAVEFANTQSFSLYQGFISLPVWPLGLSFEFNTICRDPRKFFCRRNGMQVYFGEVLENQVCQF